MSIHQNKYLSSAKTYVQDNYLQNRELNPGYNKDTFSSTKDNLNIAMLNTIMALVTGIHTRLDYLDEKIQDLAKQIKNSQEIFDKDLSDLQKTIGSGDKKLLVQITENLKNLKVGNGIESKPTMSNSFLTFDKDKVKNKNVSI